MTEYKSNTKAAIQECCQPKYKRRAAFKTSKLTINRFETSKSLVGIRNKTFSSIWFNKINKYKSPKERASKWLYCKAKIKPVAIQNKGTKKKNKTGQYNILIIC